MMINRSDQTHECQATQPFGASEPNTELVSIGGVRIKVRTFGRGPRMLVLHGFTLSSWQWEDLVAPLASNHTVMVADHPGHGGSDPTEGSFSLARNACLFGKLLDHVGAAEVVGIGHSAGAMTLLHLAAAQPNRIAAMILVAGAHRLSRQGRELARSDSVELGPPQYQQLLHRLHPGGQTQIDRLFTQFRGFHSNHADFSFSPEFLATIPTPTLLIWGDRDEYFLLEFGVELYRSLPKAQLMVCPGQGHVPLWPELGGSPILAKLFPELASTFFAGIRLSGNQRSTDSGR